jgi:hypothetical protein
MNKINRFSEQLLEMKIHSFLAFFYSQYANTSLFLKILNISTLNHYFNGDL